MESLNGLRASGQQTDQRRFTGRRLDDATALAATVRMQERLGQSNHFAQPVHNDRFQFGASGR